MIIPAFFEANYEVLESLLRERKRQMRNEDLHTELEYFSEEYDEEMEMEPRPAQVRETTPVLRTEVERNSEGGRPSKRRADDNRHQGVNLPPLLAAHLGRSENGQPLVVFNLYTRRPSAFGLHRRESPS
nr:reverse transcriptase domain-containing protein [Tanacetum cinerariifolium]